MTLLKSYHPSEIVNQEIRILLFRLVRTKKGPEKLIQLNSKLL